MLSIQTLHKSYGDAHPDDGGITVDDVDAIAEPLAARRLIGYSPSETALYHRLRAEELL
jgi:ABC-type Na+ transport system ATPase subunit NatA